MRNSGTQLRLGRWAEPALISDEQSFGYKDLEDLEHVVGGVSPSAGIFKGRVKAFGKWLPSDITIVGFAPSKPGRFGIGSFHIRIGTF